jgi:hypothetical protein
MKMKKMMLLMLTLLIWSVASINAQVRIGGAGDPYDSALLDVNKNDDPAPAGNLGLSLPRVNLTLIDQQLGGKNPKDGTIVYNAGTGLDGSGIYYWATNKWVKIQGGTFVESDGIVGNEIQDTIPNSGLTRSGSGTAVSPYKVGIKDGGVTTAKIAANAIDSTKIKNLAVGQEDLAPNSVNTSKLLNLAVTGAKIANKTIPVSKIMVTDSDAGKMLINDGVNAFWAASVLPLEELSTGITPDLTRRKVRVDQVYVAYPIDVEIPGRARYLLVDGPWTNGVDWCQIIGSGPLIYDMPNIAGSVQLRITNVTLGNLTMRGIKCYQVTYE